MSTDERTDAGDAPAGRGREGLGADGDGERTVLDLIEGIRSGAINPKLLSVEDRRSCVGYMLGEGAQISQIAKTLRRSEKTIGRDRDELEKAQALRVDPEFAARFAGRLLREAEGAVARIRRVARDAACPHSVRVEAERAGFGIMNDLAERLQSMCFLPTAAQRVEASVAHRPGEVPRLEQIEAEILRLRQVSRSVLPDGDGATEALSELESLTVRARLAGRVQQVASAIDGTAPRPVGGEP